jgi:hypothetical protein
MARDEFHHGAHHSAEMVMRKVGSKRSLQSKCSHSSSEDQFVEDKRQSRSASPFPGLSYSHSQRQRDLFSERKGVRTQTLSEEREVSSMDGGSDESFGRRRRSRSQGDTSLSQHCAGFETQLVHGQSSRSIDDSATTLQPSRRGNVSLDVPKAKPAGSKRSEKPNRAETAH